MTTGLRIEVNGMSVTPPAIIPIEGYLEYQLMLEVLASIKRKQNAYIKEGLDASNLYVCAELGIVADRLKIQLEYVNQTELISEAVISLKDKINQVLNFALTLQHFLCRTAQGQDRENPMWLTPMAADINKVRISWLQRSISWYRAQNGLAPFNASKQVPSKPESPQADIPF